MTNGKARPAEGAGDAPGDGDNRAPPGGPGADAGAGVPGGEAGVQSSLPGDPRRVLVDSSRTRVAGRPAS